MTTIKFKEIKLTASKSGKCAFCGKQAKRTQHFWQTVNPFNKNTDGSVKTSDEIKKEISKEAELWKDSPVYHIKCESN